MQIISDAKATTQYVVNFKFVYLYKMCTLLEKVSILCKQFFFISCFSLVGQSLFSYSYFSDIIN